jgi:hypothetical protein
MNPQEKAIELYNYYEQLGRDFTRGVSMKEFAKLCALKAVDEILLSQFQFDMMSIYGTPFNYYWQEVKKEIEKL